MFSLVLLVLGLLNPAQASFTDVPSNHNFSLDIKYLEERGIISGYADGSFHPDVDIPRAEALAMIFKSKGEEVTNYQDAEFTDIYPEDWYYATINYAWTKGMVNGNPDGSFRPRNTVNTAEALKMINQVFYDELDPPDYQDDPLLEMQEGDWFAPYLIFSQQKGIINKNKYYHPAKPLTRAELTSMLHRMLLVQAGDLETINDFNTKSNSEYQLFIPKLNVVDVPINYVEDFTDYNKALDVLWNGVGNFRYQPGTLGKIVIYGHSSYYEGHPLEYKHVFRYLDELEPGDRIYINYKNKGYIYEVFQEQIVDPTHLEVLQSYGYEELALFTCWPRDTIQKRYVVNARRVN